MNKEKYPTSPADERLVKAAFEAADMALSLKQPVQVTVDGNTVNYEIGEKAVQEFHGSQPVVPKSVEASTYTEDWKTRNGNSSGRRNGSR